MVALTIVPAKPKRLTNFGAKVFDKSLAGFSHLRLRAQSSPQTL